MIINYFIDNVYTYYVYYQIYLVYMQSLDFTLFVTYQL